MTNETTKYFLAFDLGATSGCSTLGTLKNGKLELEELTRFTNKIIQHNNKYYWDINALFNELKNCLKLTIAKGIKVDAIGIDSWGVDFVCIDKNGEVIDNPRCYRDPYTNGKAKEYFKLISQQELYNTTGIQIMDINTIFQLYASSKETNTPLPTTDKVLLIADSLSYMLTGNKVCEYTIASTSQLLNPRTQTIESKLLSVMNVDTQIIAPIITPGEKMGTLSDKIAKECGTNNIPVVAVAGHDTASAVVAVPATNKNFAYLSSGTWSLMGIEVDEPIINEESYRLNFTNEGGVEGTTRFLKNITGMWILEQCKEVWRKGNKEYTHLEIEKLTESIKPFQWFIDPDHSDFTNPTNMVEAIHNFCKRTNQPTPKTDAEYLRCIFDSLVLKYRYVLESLQKLAPFPIEKLHIIGGGSKNNMLNQATANATGLCIVAGPAEASTIGNIMIQAKGLGMANSLSEIRKTINDSFSFKTFHPQNTQEWTDAYNKFTNHIKIIS